LLERLARHLEQTEALTRQLRAALLYPAVVLAVAAVVLTLIMVTVVPAFENTFASFGAQLPWATQWVIAGSRWLLQWGPALLLALLALVLAARQAWARSPQLVQRLDAAVLELPLWGAMLRQAAQVRWSRTLATLLGFCMLHPCPAPHSIARSTSGRSCWVSCRYCLPLLALTSLRLQRHPAGMRRLLRHPTGSNPW
jgi:type II secretory pathway component PulF